MGRADFERARELYPSVTMGESEIVARLEANPEIAYRIVGDIYDAVLAEEEKARGVRRMGRRPTRSQVPLSQVWDVVLPAPYSMDPFPEAMVKLLNGRSQRQFARKIPCHQTTLSRLMAGTLRPDLSMLERIAVAADVRPHYFREWRALYISQLIEELFMANPNMSVTALQEVRRGTR